ncbi:MAG: nitroreductase [Deltaproteobacteria bacterium]|nr:nitroreductase [Deltaproteobacteria bacterium]
MPNKETHLPTVCRICMIQLMRLTYQKYWWFRLVREPLVWGLYFLALVNRLPIKTYAAANPECRGCLRFIKAELDAKSATFRFLNRFLGPLFNKVRDPRLDPQEVAAAKDLAAERMKSLEPEKPKGQNDDSSRNK